MMIFVNIFAREKSILNWHKNLSLKEHTVVWDISYINFFTK